MRAMLKILLSILLFPHCFNGCSQPKQPAERPQPTPSVYSQVSSNWQTFVEKPPLSPRTLSPFAIRDFINGVDKNLNEFYDFTPLWERLQIDKGENDSFEGFTPSYSHWQAQTFREINTQRGKLVVLKIVAMGGAIRRYLIFRKEHSTQAKISPWKILGNIDILDNKYEGSPHQKYHRIIVMGNHIWLLLRNLANRGTGVYQINEAWYRIDIKKPKKVVEYAVEGYSHIFGDVSERNFSTKVERYRPMKRGYQVEIQYSARYGGNKTRFSKKQMAIYNWKRGSGIFTLDKARSELSEEEIEDVFNTGCIPHDRFLTYNYAELEQIAKYGSAVQKRWLKECSSRMENHSKKLILEKLLRRRFY
jgi:hypothetical protein